nr:DUF805 domain-containing protein [uncultured Campylobacter sp.]
MTFGESIKSCLSGYVKFDGRAPRSEYWWFLVFIFLVDVVAACIDLSASTIYEKSELVSTLAGLALLLPNLAVCVRRLHDLNKSGWWVLLFFIPIIGHIVLIVWFATRGTVGANNFGEDPLAAA